MVTGQVSCRGCPRGAAGGAFPFTSASRVCVHFARLFDVMSEKKCDVHTAVLTAALSQRGKQQILCEHVCLCEVERGFFFLFFFWQGFSPYSPSLILPFLSPPIIWLRIR